MFGQIYKDFGRISDKISDILQTVLDISDSDKGLWHAKGFLENYF